MIRNCKTLFSMALFFTSANFVSATEMPEVEQLFKQNCALCHAIDKKKLGPAINTMNNERAVLVQTITKGKKSMPSYEGKLTGVEIDAIADYLLANQ